MNKPALQLDQPQTTLVPTGQMGVMWPRVFDMLAPAVERSNGRWTMNDLAHALFTGNQWLWVAFDPQTSDIIGAVTTQIITYPSAKRMAFQFLGGTDFDEWFKPMLATLESCAKDCGCDGTEGTARMGFKPYLIKEGYEMKYAIYDKPFGGEDHE